MARAYDSPLELKRLSFLQKLPILKFHRTPADSLRSQAELGFHALGSVATCAVPDLMKIYQRAPSPAVQDVAIVALGGIGPPASDAVPLMIEAATNSDWLLSGNAVWALGQVHSRPELSLPALVDLLENTNPAVCVHLGPQAAMSLGKFGETARPAVPHLVRLLQCADPYVRSHITNAFKAIDPEAAAQAGAE
jgi:HEAT repeat protein